MSTSRVPHRFWRPATMVTAAVLTAAAGTQWLGGDSGAARRSTVTSARVPDASTTTSTPQPNALASTLTPIVASTPSACARVTEGDRVLVDANSNVPFVGASVNKLFTAAAALQVLGPDARLRTTVRGAPPVDGGIAGDIWLVGGGDAVLGTDAWAATLPAPGRLYTSLDELADRLVAAGVTRVEGRVVGDDSRYDTQRRVPSIPARLVADGEIGPLSALSVNDGFRVWGHPGVPFANPPEEAASVFARLLTDRGVGVGGAATGKAPDDAAELAAIESPPVGELVHAMLRDSDNNTAELLVKELGRRRFEDGSTPTGVRAVREVMPSRTTALSGTTLSDGSGLGDGNRVTCEALTTLLAQRSGLLSGRLAIAATDGTLRRRFGFARGLIRAKTGSLDGVAALAGYARTPEGQTVQFAYVVNGLRDTASGRALQDRFVAALVSAPTKAGGS